MEILATSLSPPVHSVQFISKSECDVQQSSWAVWHTSHCFAAHPSHHFKPRDRLVIAVEFFSVQFQMRRATKFLAYLLVTAQKKLP
jgi:hypothetical protein